ncbi:DUF3943 domain-containing protein [Aliivibrio fischeri]|uniref:DUF3943 domain-containing protein n=1 Tax=Aliivibrio fischeri TaxID=668 RepID=UPI002E36C96C|nr:DUF3943 domain-containing protein [Aliivibrio fischeri]MCE7553909.1 DUF3943 domain-containing protein [Aliivibrio fischeri]MCE7561239.1 DUF3943 domain-containing protein [Aliivibrio fischeri]MCE7568647.1 DUF3943 domain-containing protein [Aliivibrio fischeri]
MKKQAIAGLLLGCTASTNAFALDTNSAYDMDYQDDCSTNIYSSYCSNASFDFSPMRLDGEAPSKVAENDSLAQSTQLPHYLRVSDERDWDYLMEQSYTILGLSVATVGLMTFLPESITKWDSEDSSIKNLGSKWKDNVSQGPVWDKDEHFLNYVMHPYFGGVYYTAARHAGFNEFESFLYSTTMSTFFWEYGVEAFAEVPSIQDLFVTPFFGAVVGEVMLQQELRITENGGEVMGSETLGSVSLFFLNPVGHIHYWVTDAWGDETEVNLAYNAWFSNGDAAQYAYDAGMPYTDQFIGLEVKLKF